MLYCKQRLLESEWLPLTKKEIIILQTSDIHGVIFPYHYADLEKRDWGFGKIATLIEQQRRDHEHVLLVDNGDVSQGTPLMYHHVKQKTRSQHPIVKTMNALNYDACILGNHEFNYGMDVLHEMEKEAHFPFLSCNILNKETSEPYFGKPYVIKQINDIKVCILGATTHFIPNWENPKHIESLSFINAKKALEEWVDFIHHHEQPDVMIVSYHGGFEASLDDYEPEEECNGENQGIEICRSIFGIDVLLTGHQHRKIAGKIVNGVIVVQPGSKGEQLGKVTIELTKQQDQWIITNKKSELLSVENVQASASILSLVQKEENDTQKWLDTPIGNVQGSMRINHPFQTRLKEHPFIEFINRVQMEVAEVDISCTALFDNEAKGLSNRVTMREIVSNYIYPNSLKVVSISGSIMKAALERSASYFTYKNGQIKVSNEFLYPKPQHYNYDMWEGIDYVIDVTKPVGQRITSLMYKGKPVEMNQQYKVVMNNYRAVGGGSYFMFHYATPIRDIPIDMTELIANYFEKHPTVQATTNQNWKVITGLQTKENSQK